MNAGNELVIGIVLIAAGLALAILGYVIFTNREEEPMLADSPSEEPEEPDETAGVAEADLVPATLDEADEFIEPVDISLPAVGSPGERGSGRARRNACPTCARARGSCASRARNRAVADRNPP